MKIIEAINLEKVYGDGVKTPVLKGVSFSVNEGEFVAIMGPSGSGKSTLLHVLGFLDKPTAGIYRFDGKAMGDYSKNELARVRNKKMGFIFQSFNLLPRTKVLDNVKLPLLYSGIKEKLWDDLAEKAIESVGLSHRLDHEPSQLSGGEQQRAAIARSLVANPSVIFADEPTGNLDSKSGENVMQILQSMNEKEGHTVLLITHDSHIAQYAQRIIHIKDGQIESDRPVKNRIMANEKIS